MTESFRASFQAPADFAAVELVHRMFERLAEERPGLPERTRTAVELAVVEVVTNVVQHSPGQPTVTVELVIDVTADGLSAVVCDDAPPVDIDLAAAEMPDADELVDSGRGLALVGMLVDRFEHTNLPDGNRWTLSSQLVEAT